GTRFLRARAALAAPALEIRGLRAHQPHPTDRLSGDHLFTARIATPQIAANSFACGFRIDEASAGGLAASGRVGAPVSSFAERESTHTSFSTCHSASRTLAMWSMNSHMGRSVKQ